VEYPLAEAILRCEFKPGTVIRMDADEQGLSFTQD
jgi:hypothetical protein